MKNIELYRKANTFSKSIAINAKIADLTNSLDISRLNGNKPPKYDDYRRALSYLTIIK